MEVNTDIEGLTIKKELGRVEYSMVRPGLILAVNLGRADEYSMIIKTDSENVAMMMGTGELFYIMPNYSVASIHKYEYNPLTDKICIVDISNKRNEWLLKNDSQRFDFL